MITSLYEHRGYIWRTAWSDVRNRYAGAGLGVVWNLLQPLSMILIFTVIFTRVMPQAAQLGAPYPVYLCSALLPWSAFAECINRGTNAFIVNAIYLRKLPIPEQVFAAQAALSTAIGLTLSFVTLVVVAAALGHVPSWHWALLPIPLALLVGMGFGLGMMLGTLNAFIRDVGQVVPIVLQVWFWLYPVVYHPNSLPTGMRRAIVFNPVYPFMESIRALFIAREIPSVWLWLGMLGWAAAAGVVGYVVLRRLRPELRDVL
jgi:ABC-type polysaccharide/polyol phosphate export permease